MNREITQGGASRIAKVKRVCTEDLKRIRWIGGEELVAKNLAVPIQNDNIEIYSKNANV